ncbi:hypothetical protein [Saccharothrix lopnurensis]|uniref:Uncharacterized protein n=1 Tax=Saccharothrix lopnurensis TaxID=1670621 RepID=A0ABW1PEW0_9PSEU
MLTGPGSEAGQAVVATARAENRTWPPPARPSRSRPTRPRGGRPVGLRDLRVDVVATVGEHVDPAEFGDQPERVREEVPGLTEPARAVPVPERLTSAPGARRRSASPPRPAGPDCGTRGS